MLEIVLNGVLCVPGAYECSMSSFMYRSGIQDASLIDSWRTLRLLMLHG